MLIKTRIPELFLGALMAVAVFGMGFVFGSLPQSGNSTQNQSAAKSQDAGAEYKEQKNWWNDAVADFTLGLVLVGLFQAGLFYVQLRLIRKSMIDAEIAAKAAKDAADASKIQANVAKATLASVQRPYIFVFGIDRLMTRDDVASVTPFVEYVVANYGQTPAIIENVGAGFHEGQTPDVPIRVDDDHNLFVSPILEPRERRSALKELRPEAFIAEDLGVIVDLATSTTYPSPKLRQTKICFFALLSTTEVLSRTDTKPARAGATISPSDTSSNAAVEITITQNRTSGSQPCRPARPLQNSRRRML